MSIQLSSGIEEMEAESVAYVTCRHFGLQSKGSPNYLALHNATAKDILERLERIRVMAMEIIEFVEQDDCES